MYYVVPIPVRKEKVAIGNKKELRVISVGRLNLRPHQETKHVDVTLRCVFVTENVGLNLFSLHDLQQRHTIGLDNKGVNMVVADRI